MNSTPEYYEPWSANGNHVYDNLGHHKAQFNYGENARRTAVCVSACAGMADPVKELARLKSCSDELDSILSVIPEDAPCHHAETGEMVADYILDLQKEVGKVHALYFNANQQLEAMREAIREAHTALDGCLKYMLGVSVCNLDLECETMDAAHHALAKLQPFIQ